jgi:hypothetical protein
LQAFEPNGNYSFDGQMNFGANLRDKDQGLSVYGEGRREQAEVDVATIANQNDGISCTFSGSLTGEERQDCRVQGGS